MGCRAQAPPLGQEGVTPRVVLDTNVVASALLWGGSPLALLRAAESGNIALYSSVALLAELAAVLARRKFSAKVAASGLSVDELVQNYAALAPAIQAAPVHPVVTADPADDAVLACAVGARADWLVT